MPACITSSQKNILLLSSSSNIPFLFFLFAAHFSNSIEAQIPQIRRGCRNSDKSVPVHCNMKKRSSEVFQDRFLEARGPGSLVKQAECRVVWLGGEYHIHQPFVTVTHPYSHTCKRPSYPSNRDLTRLNPHMHVPPAKTWYGTLYTMNEASTV